jgi:hypothetical protein
LAIADGLQPIWQEAEAGFERGRDSTTTAENFSTCQIHQFLAHRSIPRTAKEEKMAEWHFSGDYFENCNCSVVCPCFVSKAAPLTSRPTEGVCDVALIFHIESGSYDDTVLDGLNVALAVHTPGPMGEGNWTVAAYIDQNANDKQTEALGAIFTGAAGGPIAQLTPLFGKNLGAKKVPITYRVEGKKRSAEIPNILHMGEHRSSG